MYDSVSLLYNGDGVARRTPNRYYSVLLDSADVKVEHHLFPNDGSLAGITNNRVGGGGEVVKRVVEGLSGRIEISLCLDVVCVALFIELVVAAERDIFGVEHGGKSVNEAGGEVCSLSGGDTELTRGRLSSVCAPRRQLYTCDVLWVRLGDNRRVSWRVEFCQDVDPSLTC